MPEPRHSWRAGRIGPTLGGIVLCLLTAVWTPGAFGAAAADRDPDRLDREFRIPTADGELVVLDGASASRRVRRDAGYIAFWWDRSTGEVYVYDRMMVSSRDLTAAAARLEHQFGVELIESLYRPPANAAVRNRWAKQRALPAGESTADPPWGTDVPAEPPLEGEAIADGGATGEPDGENEVWSPGRTEPDYWVPADPQVVAGLLGLPAPVGPGIREDCVCPKLDDGGSGVAAAAAADSLDEIASRSGIKAWCRCGGDRGDDPGDGGDPWDPPPPSPSNCVCCVVLGNRILAPDGADVTAVADAACCQYCCANQCDDHDECTYNDHCDGSCVGEPRCDDGDPCTYDVCHPVTFECSNPDKCLTDHGQVCCAGVCCNDPCSTDCCNAAEGQERCCVGECANFLICCPGIVCPNGLCCEGNACEIPICGESPWCDHESPCEPDGTVCTIERCSVAEVGCGHECYFVSQTAGYPCEDDQKACTKDECDGSGQCGHTPEPQGTPCESDGIACTADECDNDGNCDHIPGGACDDGDPCTDDSCHPVLGCVHDTVPVSQ